jgi:hypothetical protein
MPGTHYACLWADIDSVVAYSAANGGGRKYRGRNRNAENDANQKSDKAKTSFAISLFRLALVDVRRLEH